MSEYRCTIALLANPAHTASCGGGQDWILMHVAPGSAMPDFFADDLLFIGSGEIFRTGLPARR